MFNGLRQRLTYANVVSTLCLFILLGGSAYAVTRLSANSVGTRQIKNRAVTLVKIAPRAQRSLRGHRGPTGRDGAQGPSDVYIDGVSAANLSSSPINAGTLNLPAGNYLLQAKVDVFGGAVAGDVQCGIGSTLATTQNSGGTLDSGNEAPAQNRGAVITLTTFVRSVVPYRAVLGCRQPNGSGATIDDSRITAIRTSAVHGIAPVD
jgi:hypothetical protein